MEKFILRENGFLGYAQSQPKTPNGSAEDMDFNDVFGGPPRRISIQDVKLRYSFGDAVESHEEIVSSALNEKPVFGDDGVPRRRHHQGDDFFDDIFKGEESYNSPRRTTDRDSAFGSSPGSRILSPSKPLPPLGTSVPSQFSLPAKLTKSLEIPTFAVNGQNKMDASSNGLNSPQSSIPLSRFISQAIQGQDEIPVYRQSPLSRGVSLSGEDTLPTLLTSDHKENVDNKEKDRRNVDGLGNQFHFSIYKWAGREVPMMMSLVGRDATKARDGYDRSASSNGRIEGKLSARVGKTRGFSAAGSEALKVEPKKEDLGSQEEVKDHSVVSDGARQNIKERGKSMDDIDVQAKAEREVPLRKGESGRYENIDVREKTEKQFPLKKQDSLRFEKKALRTFLRDEIDSPKRTEEKFPLNKEESLQSELKPLQAFFDGGMELPGNIEDRKENKKRIPNGIHSSSHDSNTAKGNERMNAPSNNGVVDGPNLQDAATVDSGMSHGENGVKGKVREFVQIFNQDADSRPKSNLQRRSKSSRWKAVDADQKESGMSTNVAEVKEQVNLHNVAKKPDVSVKADENLNKDETQQNSPTKARGHTTQCSTNQKNGFASEKFHRDSRVYIENFDDLLEDDFLVQELPDDHETVAESEHFDDTKAIDAKIRQWSSGKKGNIRSLLSTLQFVLWTESGWKPIPLADLIETNSVKRAYQKALLRLHPDKLQQKGAAFHQKYTAEKVFDILQEAWDQFNALVPL